MADPPLRTYWNYLRRQLFVMDTYASPHNRRVNHTMLALHCYLSWALVAPLLTGGAPSPNSTVSCFHPLVSTSIAAHSPIPASPRCCWALLLIGDAVMCWFSIAMPCPDTRSARLPCPRMRLAQRCQAARLRVCFCRAASTRLAVWAGQIVLLPTQHIYGGPGTSWDWLSRFGGGSGSGRSASGEWLC